MLAFLLGGARSGKSLLAQRLAARAAGGAMVTVVVTGEAGDDEMADRILRHRADRPAGWPTVAAPRHLLAALTALPDDTTVLIDCVSFWVANRVMYGDGEPAVLAEAEGVAAWPVPGPAGPWWSPTRWEPAWCPTTSWPAPFAMSSAG